MEMKYIKFILWFCINHLFENDITTVGGKCYCTVILTSVITKKAQKRIKNEITLGG